jgi:hypothetical protein
MESDNPPYPMHACEPTVKEGEGVYQNEYWSSSAGLLWISSGPWD